MAKQSKNRVKLETILEKKGAFAPFFFLAVAPAARLLATACLLAAIT